MILSLNSRSQQLATMTTQIATAIVGCPFVIHVTFAGRISLPDGFVGRLNPKYVILLVACLLFLRLRISRYLLPCLHYKLLAKDEIPFSYIFLTTFLGILGYDLTSVLHSLQ